MIRIFGTVIATLSVYAMLVAAPVHAVVDAPIPAGAKFEVQGNKIIDPRGRPFIIKGITSPYGVYCGGVDNWDSVNTIDRDFGIIKDLGCNFVRICVTYKLAGTETKRAKLIRTVAKAREKGFVVEIANSYTSYASNLTKPVGDQPSWLAWLAHQWKDDPYVWLVPMNEPNGSPPGDKDKVGDWSFWQREQNECIQAIREAGYTAPLMINMPDWSWNAAKIERFPLADPLHNIVYGVHRYADDNMDFADEEREECDKGWGKLAKEYPIVVEEVGAQNSPAKMQLEWNRGFMDYCADWVNDKGGCGVVAFNWYWCDDNSMSGDWRRGRNSGELTAWGRIFRDNYLKRLKAAK